NPIGPPIWSSSVGRPASGTGSVGWSVSRRFPWSITGSSLPSVAGRIQENLCRCGTLNTFMTQVTARSTAAVDHAATAWCGLLGMAWSTREIAELAGTSLRAVRHYHEVGLLAEPERRANGYKQ